MHTIAVTNISTEVLSIEKLTIESSLHGQTITKHILRAEEIQALAEPITGRIDAGLGRVLDLILFMDEVVSEGTEPVATCSLRPNDVLVLPNIYLSFPSIPNLLSLDTSARNKNGELVRARTSIKILKYKSINEYTLPVEGSWFMKAIPETGRLNHHRFGVSNEFGVDFLKLGPDGELFKNEGKSAADWYSYGHKVLAAADGKVVSSHGSSIQEWTRFNPREGETIEDFHLRQLSQVQKAMAGDILDWSAGNYLVIQHAGCEFSSYLHLKEGSLRVKIGDEVLRGTHIADVGNTGDSFGAHLHFQIMNSGDLIKGRSLPFHFSDLECDLDEPGRFIHRKTQVS